MNMQNTLPRNDIHRTGNEQKTFLNPMINKLTSIKERSEEVSTYGGILTKFGYFLLMIFVGIALAVIFHQTGVITVNPATDELFVEKFAIIGILVSVGVFLIFPFIAFLIRKTIPVTGALYCVATGYLLGFCMVLDTGLCGTMMLAMALTFSIVAVMGILYFKGIIRITQKFRAVVITLFSTMLTASFLMFICSFIPMLREGIMALQNNLYLSLAAAVGGVVIATLFLLIDFETIRQTVEDRLPREYEWFAAFGFMFTVVWLYLKVLQLVIKLKDMN